MVRPHFVVGVCLCLLTLVAVPGFAQLSGKLSFNGTVFADGNDLRIANATVLLCDHQGNRLEEARSNDGGEFSFSNINPGNYVLRVSADGFESFDQRVDLSLTPERGFPVALKPIHKDEDTAGGSLISAHELSMPEAARERVAAGKKKLYQDKNAQGALSDFEAATKKAPGYYEAFYQAGMAYLGLQNENDAEKEFRKSVEISKEKYGDADIALGTLLLHRQEAQDADKILREGLALNPQSWAGQVELGKLEMARGHMEAALSAAEKAEAIAPTQPVVYRLLGIIHFKEKDYPALKVDLDNYVRLDPDSAAGVRAKELLAQVEQQLAHAATTSAAAGVK
jgi:tetratricopeptide (TPR) repeat protein